LTIQGTGLFNLTSLVLSNGFIVSSHVADASGLSATLSVAPSGAFVPGTQVFLSAVGPSGLPTSPASIAVFFAGIQCESPVSSAIEANCDVLTGRTSITTNSSLFDAPITLLSQNQVLQINFTSSNFIVLSPIVIAVDGVGLKLVGDGCVALNSTVVIKATSQQVRNGDIKDLITASNCLVDVGVTITVEGSWRQLEFASFRVVVFSLNTYVRLDTYQMKMKTPAQD
jgi:hypothetical protein